MDRSAVDSVLGLPLEVAGQRLSWVEIESPTQLRARYEDGDDWVGVGLMPADSTERAVMRSARLALRYEIADGGPGDGAADVRRARVRALLEAVMRSAEARLAESDGPLTTALAHAALPARAAFDAGGLRALLPELTGGLSTGWRLVDAYPDGAGVALEIARPDDPDRLVISVAPPAARPRLFARTMGPDARDDPSVRPDASVVFSLVRALLSARAPGRLTGRPTAPSTPRAPRRGWGARLRMVRGASVPRSTPGAGAALLAASTVPELAREGAMFAPWLDALARYFGRGAELAPVPDAPVEAYAIALPAVPPELDSGPTFFHVADPAVARRREMRDYLARLGFVVDADRAIRTVPTPASFRRLLAAHGVDGDGFAPSLHHSESFRVDPTRWLDRWLHAEYRLEVAPRAFYRRLAPLLDARVPNRAWCEHLTALAHDMSVHVLAAHRVPRRRLTELGERLAPTVASCRRLGREDALMPLVELYEEDLVQECDAIWASIGRPEDFADAFDSPASRARLDGAVQLRLAQSEGRLARPVPPGARAAGWFRRIEGAATRAWRVVAAAREDG